MTLKGYAANKEGMTKTTTSPTLTYSNLNTTSWKNWSYPIKKMHSACFMPL